MTDLLNIAKECGAVFDGPCQACGGSGVVMETITVPVCCGRLSPHGDCCGNPDPAQEYQPAQCGCGGLTFMHLSTDQLHATVEKVCGPLVEALEFYANKGNWIKDIQEYGSEMSDYNVMWKDVYEFNQATRCAGFTAIDCLDKFRKLMGQDK